MKQIFIHPPRGACLSGRDGGETGEKRVRSGGQRTESVYEGAKAASDATGCRLLFFSHRH